MITAYLVLAGATCGSSLLLTLLARRFAPRFDYVDHPAERKVHTDTTPYGGGVAVYLSLLIGMGLLALLSRLPLGAEGSATGLLASFRQLWSAFAAQGERVLVIFTGATAIFLVGVVDDRWGLAPRVKLYFQLLVVFFLYWQGIAATAFLGWWFASLALTLLWVIGLTNAFNFLDNMNGLCAGLAIVSGVIFLTVAVQTEQVVVATLLALLIGAVAGFFVFNYPGGSIFLGDAGALLIGFLLATVAIEFEFYSTAGPDRYRIFPIVLPLLIFAIPIYDTASVVILRLRAGESPMKADTRHFSHRLVALGMSPALAVFTILLLAFAIGITATLLYLLSAQAAVIMLIQAAAILLVIVLLEVSAAGRP